MTSSPSHPTAPSRTALSRRGFIRGTGALSGSSLLSHAAQARADLKTQQARKAENDPARYVPRFFTAEEYRFLCHACERIFPEDENGPGALALAVPRFIDKQMQTPYGQGDLWYLHPPFGNGPPELGYQLPYSPQELYRRTIEPINTHCLMTYNALFADLTTTQQDEVLHKLEDGVLQFNDIPGAVFFEQLRTNTLEGAFADPLYGGNDAMGGWKMMGFPGARADFMDWVNQQGAPYPLGPVGMPPNVAPYGPDALHDEED